MSVAARQVSLQWCPWLFKLGSDIAWQGRADSDWESGSGVIAAATRISGEISAATRISGVITAATRIREVSYRSLIQ